jgi:hypothetical protein
MRGTARESRSPDAVESPLGWARLSGALPDGGAQMARLNQGKGQAMKTETDYLVLEKRLAKLKYPDHLITYSDRTAAFVGLLLRHPAPNIHIPKWCRDPAENHNLVVGHEANITFYPEKVMVDFYSPAGVGVTTSYADHPTKSAAVMYTVVQAVIAKLESQHENQN